ncbi:MAG: DUF2795 domain-containing protein [Actinomycetota bacterium]|nr:DUF2795 domain-containing protein [Actinomycetota bacterium]
MPGTGLPTADAVRDALQNADFPAGKDDLIRTAEETGASGDVLAALRSLPVADYASKDEVVRSVETAEATGATPSQHAAQARTEARPGLAQHQRTAGP